MLAAQKGDMQPPWSGRRALMIVLMQAEWRLRHAFLSAESLFMSLCGAVGKSPSPLQKGS